MTTMEFIDVLDVIWENYEVFDYFDYNDIQIQRVTGFAKNIFANVEGRPLIKRMNYLEAHSDYYITNAGQSTRWTDSVIHKKGSDKVLVF